MKKFYFFCFQVASYVPEPGIVQQQLVDLQNSNQ